MLTVYVVVSVLLLANAARAPLFGAKWRWTIAPAMAWIWLAWPLMFLGGWALSEVVP
jgi:hypothetical protein